jgi:hypothetical protein
VGGASRAPALVLGPVLRYVGSTEATVWVETDRPCRVEVLGHASRTFEVAGHHYALVVVRGLEPGKAYEYGVRLDGRPRWPDPAAGFPPSVIRTVDPQGTLRLAFGSCRLAYPHRAPYTLSPDRHPLGRGVDACWALAERLRRGGVDGLPDLLLHLGDQVYADEPSPAVAELVRSRRRAPDVRAVLGFDEYAALYRESWGEPSIRWLLSTVPNAMVFDDHEVHDDWNTSQAWLEAMRAQPWWEEHMTSALASYWAYQHLGNLGPEALERDGLLADLATGRGDRTTLRRWAGAQAEPARARWSYRRVLGSVRLVVLDSRARRVLEPGRRDMLDAAEWRWLAEAITGDFDHLLLATSLPFLLPMSIHHLESWNERVCEGAWGGRARAFGERLRQDLDLEHWAAFTRAFDRLASLLARAAVGRVSVTCLSGDVHFGYLAETEPRAGSAPIRQVVCSPMRNPLGRRMRRAFRAAASPLLEAATGALARSAGAPRPSLGWRIRAGPWFGNMIAELRFRGTEAGLRLEQTSAAEPRLHTALLASLGGEAQPGGGLDGAGDEPPHAPGSVLIG